MLENANLRLIFCVAGLFGSFLLYGVAQERIMTQPYGEDPETGKELMFTSSAFLVFINRIVCVVAAAGILLYKGEKLNNQAPLTNYFAISMSNVLATYCQYEALKSISFPTQTLGKCGKIIPVMITGTFLLKKKYGASDYLEALGITTGCMIFLLTGDISGGNDKTDTPWGLFLMAGYLFSDSFTSVIQEKLFKDFSVSTWSQMLWDNICSAVISMIALLLSGTFFSAFQFAMTYPQLMFDALLLSFFAFTGKAAIYYTIKEFGSLIFSIVMTTRQFASMVLSSLIFLHPLTMYQWLGALIVFGIIYYKTVNKKRGGHGHGHGSAKPSSSSSSGMKAVVGDDEEARMKAKGREEDLQSVLVDPVGKESKGSF
ncbi:Adenosine 3'-phospho 5'-phosphosulfate transporter 1 [Balamuthia mandrillaris]